MYGPPSWAHCQRVTPAVLFDRVPGWPTASDLAVRSTWPAAPAWYAAGENIAYRERVVDIQYGGWSGGRPHDLVYRRFDTHRIGRGAR